MAITLVSYSYLEPGGTPPKMLERAISSDIRDYLEAHVDALMGLWQARWGALDPGVLRQYREVFRGTLALEALIREDHAAGRPLLAAYAVSKSRGGLPGRGFFELLSELGRADGPDEAANHHQEFQAAKSYWGGQS